MARHIIVTDRDTDAEAYVARRDSAPARYYDYLIPILKRAEFAAIMKPNKEMPDDELTVAWALSNFIVAGSAQTVAEKILAFREAVGPFGTIVMVGHDWDDPQVHKRSMQLMAERVMPLLNEATR